MYVYVCDISYLKQDVCYMMCIQYKYIYIFMYEYIQIRHILILLPIWENYFFGPHTCLACRFILLRNSILSPKLDYPCLSRWLTRQTT